MLINYVHDEECRIAILQDEQLQELYTERTSDDLHVGNIYHGKVTNVEPSIGAAFVDFGLERNGFLHISDLHPKYFPGTGETIERVGKKIPRRDRPPIQDALKRGQEVLVQVLKEGIGTKGPTLTSYLSIPGRFLVLMPGMEQLGVSRKIEDDQIRRDARRTLDQLDLPAGFGFIIRTAGIGKTKTQLKRDLAYLQRLWKTIDQRMKQSSGPCELYTESDLIIRTIRDVLTPDINRIIVDNPTAAQRARDFLRIAMPRGGTKVVHYNDAIPMFDAFDIEHQIDSINSREIPLECGGSLVFDQTEAMVTVDVNSGKFRGNNDSETTAYMTNIEAVDEIARQLHLRDMGGLIVLDLIDMYQTKHRKEIENRFRNNLKTDRARTKVLRINELGLLSLTRQRMRPSLKKALYLQCPTCHGSGHILRPESVAINLIRRLAVVLSNPRVNRIELILHPNVISVFISSKKKALLKLEETHNKHIDIRSDMTISPDKITMHGFDQRNVRIDLTKLPKPKPPVLNKTTTTKTTTTKPDAIKSSQPDHPEQKKNSDNTKRKRRRKSKSSAKPVNATKPVKPDNATTTPSTKSDTAQPIVQSSTSAKPDNKKNTSRSRTPSKRHKWSVKGGKIVSKKTEPSAKPQKSDTKQIKTSKKNTTEKNIKKPTTKKKITRKRTRSNKKNNQK